MNSLIIPLDSGPVIVHYPISEEDYDLLLKSLDLWKNKLIQEDMKEPDPPTP